MEEGRRERTRHLLAVLMPDPLTQSQCSFRDGRRSGFQFLFKVSSPASETSVPAGSTFLRGLDPSRVWTLIQDVGV